MMPKKAAEIKRSHLIGVKVNEETKIKINYLAGMKGEKAGTYIYNLLLKHIEEKEPWISKEIKDLSDEERLNLLKPTTIDKGGE